MVGGRRPHLVQAEADRAARDRGRLRGEECDDGNGSNTDACLNACVAARCGDSFVQLTVEACDDGNDDDDNGDYGGGDGEKDECRWCW